MTKRKKIVMATLTYVETVRLEVLADMTDAEVAMYASTLSSRESRNLIDWTITKVRRGDRCGFLYSTEHGEPRTCALPLEAHLEGMDEPHQFGAGQQGT